MIAGCSFILHQMKNPSRKWEGFFEPMGKSYAFSSAMKALKLSSS